MTPTKLETLRLSTCTIVRPAGTCGSMGWSPKAWQCVAIKRGQSPIAAFLAGNKNWADNEVTMC